MKTKEFTKTFLRQNSHFIGLFEESIDKKKRFDANLTDGKILKFKKESGINSRLELENILTPANAIIVKETKVSGTPKYDNCGFLVKWNNTYYSVLLKGMAAEKPRKAFSPDNIGLAGKTYTPKTITQMRQDIVTGVTKVCEGNSKLFDTVISLLYHVESGSAVSGNFVKMKTKDRNPIICDFGEVLSAYQDLLLGRATESIQFCIKSNENVVDYYRDGEIISVKGPQGGGKLNLVRYLLGIISKSNVGKFLLAHAEHDRNNYFKYAAKLCPWVNYIANVVGGTSVDNLQNFVNTPGSYDKFYQLIKNKPFPGVGVPKIKQEHHWRRRWEEEKSLNPIWFSIITIMTRWGQEDKKFIQEITQIMKPLFSTEKFVNIAFDNVNICFVEVKFVEVNNWTTHYHSNAGGAWANWPSLKIKETK